MSKFLENLKRAREATAATETPTGDKDPAAMTDEERATEIQRLEEEVRRAEIRQIYAAREGREETPRRKPSPFSGRRRQPWT